MNFLIDIKNELVSDFNKMLYQVLNYQTLNRKTKLTPSAKKLIHKMAETCKRTNIYVEMANKRGEFVEKIKANQELCCAEDVFIISLRHIMDAPSESARLVCLVWLMPVLDEVVKGKIKLAKKK